MIHAAVPWVVRAGPSLLVFNAVRQPGLQLAGEYAVLLQAALNLATTHAAAANARMHG
jgi:hypothetical protein